MKRLEQFVYESRPFNCLILALYATTLGLDRWGQASVALLAMSALVIFYWRYQYRSTVQLRRR